MVALQLYGGFGWVLSNKAYKSRQGQRNREEIGALLVHPARQKHTKVPCYPGYIYGGPAVVWL